MIQAVGDDHQRGYAIYEGVFTAEEMSALNSALAECDLPRSRAGSRHILSVPPIRALATDTRLVELATHWLGHPALPFKATLFDKSPSANWLVAWHQDTALPVEEQVETSGWGSWSHKQGVLYAHAPASALEQVIALRVHLDDSTTANGPLRVLAGSHVHGVLDDASVSVKAARAEVEECVAVKGSVVAMRPLLIHASSKATNDAPRRVLHIEYAASMEFGGLRLRIA